MKIKVYLVSIGPGHLKAHLTLRAAEVLQEVAHLLYPGTWLGGELLQLFTGRLQTGKEGKRLDVCVELRAFQDKGESAAVLFNGDGSLFSGDGEGLMSMGQLATWCRRQGMEVEVIPGISSFQVACSELQCDFGRYGAVPAALIGPPLDGSPRTRELICRCVRQGIPVAAICTGTRAGQLAEILSNQAEMPKEYPIVIAESLGQPGQRFTHTTLGRLPAEGEGLNEPTLFLLGIPREGSDGTVQRGETHAGGPWLVANAHRLVGGESELMGPWQLKLLKELGLRPQDTLLDMGCGTLRGGLQFIPYLEPGNYTGVEPNKYLLIEGRQLLAESDLLSRQPTLQRLAEFQSGEKKFDWILTQSVLNHLDRDGVLGVIKIVAASLAPGGRWVTTYLLNPNAKDVQVGDIHPDRDNEWLWSHINPDWFREEIRSHGLSWEDKHLIRHPRGLSIGVVVNSAEADTT